MNPQITQPAPGSTLAGASQVFQWSAGTSISQYWLYVGSAPGGNDLYDQDRGTTLSASVSGLPTDGRTLYVRLWWLRSGTWAFADFTFTAASGGANPRITTPPPGATLAGTTQVFQWTAGTSVAQYWLYVGSAHGDADLFDQDRGVNLTRHGHRTAGRRSHTLRPAVVAAHRRLGVRRLHVSRRRRVMPIRAMPWTIGADVVVRSFGGKRGTVVDVGHDGRYRVRVDAATMWCRDDQLADPPASAKALRDAARRARAGRDAHRQHAEEPASTTTRLRASASARQASAARLDLHGLSVDEAMARVMAEIDRALQQGADRLEVIHGKGSGRIKAALHRLLQSLPVVASFQVDDSNPGVTWVRF